MLPSRNVAVDQLGSVASRELLHRICVRPPYFALRDIALEGMYLYATASAESPPFLEQGPMPAAELGRHAAITGLSHAASRQDDDERRYYLAKRADCRYHPNSSPYGTPVRFRSEILELSKRTCRAAVTASAGGAELAEFVVDYTVLTEPTFRRLFRHRSLHTPLAPNPYSALLEEALTREGECAQQVIDEIPVEACVGHFDGYPAMPVAVLMGQLSYLAGRLYGDPPRPFRVTRGDVSASDLAWAGEGVRFRVWRDEDDETENEADEEGFRYTCEAVAGDRPVGGMRLWLAPVD